ncbi:MAG: S9 family peptidase [Chloroflexi bacterium]|nr:S9 family peptidase [Chloroflexota bacterium]
MSDHSSQIKPYGSWKSPISTDLIVAESVGLGQIVLDGSDVYWVEMRPAEAGRNVVVRLGQDGQIADITPPPFSVRTRVHEYGGGAFTVSGGVVYFSNYADQRVYRQEPGHPPRAITAESDIRYADYCVDRLRNRIICVQEDHTAVGQEAINTITSLDVNGQSPPQILVSGNDFYSSPRLSPDGSQLAWMTWNHPNMPWDGTELWVASVANDGTLGEAVPVAGGISESIFQPEWSPDGQLCFVSDRTGWWNLYRWDGHEVQPLLPGPLLPVEAEFGKPQWVFAACCYGFDSAERIICAYNQRGSWRIASLDIASKRLEPIDIPYSEMGRGDLKVSAGKVVFEAGSPTKPMSLLRLDLNSGHLETLRLADSAKVDASYLSYPQTVEFPTEGGRTAHAYYYPPGNGDFSAPPDEKPPLLVKTHGGPTAAASAALNLPIQYWTSRGFAVLDVNYGGSTGYGREYRQRLNGLWGITDVDDCVNAARYLVQRGLADEHRLAIDGGSAGGYTTLAVLTFRDVFQAGASYYGVSDLESLARDTHKFESRYLDALIGPYPEMQDLYQARSPINFTQQLSCPLILLQGLEDKIVPPNQAEMMFEAVRQKGIPTAYIAFEGEQHGFRLSENIKRALEAEFYFYSKVFGFEPADNMEGIPIENL